MSMYSKLYSKAEHIFSYLPPTSQDLILEYLNHLIHRRVSPNTILSSIYGLDQFFRHLPEDKLKEISQVSKPDIRFFVEQLTKRNLSASTVNSRLSALKGFFAYLVDEDYVNKNPVLRRYYVEEEKRLPRPMSEVDLKVFLAHLQAPRDRAVYLLMLRSGLRLGEVCRVQISDINWPRKHLLVRNGKGQVDRVVYFSKDAEQALRLWLQKRGYLSTYCFASPRRLDQPLCSHTIRGRMQKLLSQCSLQDKGYTPHTLRHTFATTSLNGGMELYVLKNLMGHKNLNQTLMYAQLSDQSIRESYDRAVRKVEETLSLLKEGWDEFPEKL